MWLYIFHYNYYNCKFIKFDLQLDTFLYRFRDRVIASFKPQFYLNWIYYVSYWIVENEILQKELGISAK